MFTKKIVALIFPAIAIAAGLEIGHATPTRLEVIDTLNFLDKLNPFEQQDLFLYANRNENKYRAYFENFGTSFNLTGFGVFANQVGSSSSQLHSYDSNGWLYAIYTDVEFHPHQNWDFSLGFRGWTANASRNQIKHQANGMPLVAKLAYRSANFKTGAELGFDFFKSFTIQQAEKDKYEAAGSEEMNYLAKNLSNMKSRVFQSRGYFTLHKDLSYNWWIGGGGVISYSTPLAYTGLPEVENEIAKYKELANFSMRESMAISWLFQGGRRLSAAFPLSGWSFDQYFSIDLELDQLVGEGASTRELNVGASFGIKLRAVMPFVTLKSSLAVKIMDSRRSFNLAVQINISQW